MNRVRAVTTDDGGALRATPKGLASNSATLRETRYVYLKTSHQLLVNTRSLSPASMMIIKRTDENSAMRNVLSF